MSRPTTHATSTARLLACGIVAGPLFLAVWLVQALTRDGYDPTYHPLSLLSLGDLGWIQIANFVVTGGLYLACAIGMRQALAIGASRLPGEGVNWRVYADPAGKPFCLVWNVD